MFVVTHIQGEYEQEQINTVGIFEDVKEIDKQAEKLGFNKEEDGLYIKVIGGGVNSDEEALVVEEIKILNTLKMFENENIDD